MHEYCLGSFYGWTWLFIHHLVIHIMNVIIQRIPIYFKNLKVFYLSLLAPILWLTWTRESYCQIENHSYKYSTVLIQSMFLLAQLQLSWSKVCSYWPSFNTTFNSSLFFCNYFLTSKSDNFVILNQKKIQLVQKKCKQNRKCSSIVYTNIHIMHLVCTNNSCYIWRG